MATRAPYRQRLADRRRSVSTEIEAGSIRATATLGFDAENRPLEIFLRPGGTIRPGSEGALICEDVAIVLSLALQHSVPVSRLRHSVMQADGSPASIVGAAIDLLAREGAA